MNRLDDNDIAATVGPEKLGRLLDDKGSEAIELASQNGQPHRPVFEPFFTFRQKHPALRRPLIDGLLREGEIMNVIAAPKVGKSWLASDLALSVAAGLPWLNPSSTPGLPVIKTRAGNVAIIDNELHGETLAHRLPKVAEARHISIEAIQDRLFVRSLRGELMDLFALAEMLDDVNAGDIDLLILDAFYRFLPSGYSENDNGNMTELYNVLDGIARRLECSIAVVHHTTKGNQSEKSVTDTGSGAGSQSRAADCHLVLRPHEEDDTVVMEAVTRSFKPIDPICLRWKFPVWTPDPHLDPDLLANSSNRKNARPKISLDDFVRKYCSTKPKIQEEIVMQADGVLSLRHVKDLIKQAKSAGLLYSWQEASNKPHKYSTQQPPKVEETT